MLDSQAVPDTGLSAARQVRHASRRSRSRLTVRFALDRGTREDAFELRHTSYLAERHIDPQPNGLFSDPFDDAPNCQTLVIYEGGRAVASVRLCLLDGTAGRSIPADLVFPAEVAALRQTAQERPARIIEINRLVRHPDHADDAGLVFALFRLVGYMVLHHDTDMTLSCVRRRHVAFYGRLGFREMAGPRIYHGVKFVSHLLQCPRGQYAALQRDVPILNIAPSVLPSYSRLHQGSTIPVFAEAGA